ncbi:MAG: HPr family phosphocarrier protein [Elusimicrobia bacterium]|nr:HPr family phosphocarrier protein [Elusimicrobiota bacterium]
MNRYRCPETGPRLTRSLRLKWRIGVRTAALLIQTCGRFRADIAITCGGRSANARSMLDLLCLGPLEAGTRLRVTASGPDSAAAIRALSGLLLAGVRQETCRHAGCGSTPILVDVVGGIVLYACSNWHAWVWHAWDCDWKPI